MAYGTYSELLGTSESASADAGAERLVEQRFCPVSKIAITEDSLPDDEFDKILKGNSRSVKRGLPEDGTLDFFRAGSALIGASQTNIVTDNGKFDFALVVAAVSFRLEFPRTICDGADLFTLGGGGVYGDGNRPTDPLAARILASRYTTFMSLLVNNTMLSVKVSQTPICDVPLSWVGSGSNVITEGLSISSGAKQEYTTGAPGEEFPSTVSPSVSAFSARIGDQGKKDMWSMGNGLLVKEGATLSISTKTDPEIINILNARCLQPGYLFEDARIGIKLVCTLYADRTIPARSGVL